MEIRKWKLGRDPRRCLAALGIFVFTGEEKSSHRGHRGKNTEDTEKEMKEERKEERKNKDNAETRRTLRAQRRGGPPRKDGPYRSKKTQEHRSFGFA
jgi:hypothetical protein